MEFVELPEPPFMIGDPNGYYVVVLPVTQPENPYRVLVCYQPTDDSFLPNLSLSLRFYISHRTHAELRKLLDRGNAIILPEITYGRR